MYIITRKYTVAENLLRNTISIISVCIKKFCSEASRQRFYYVAVPYIYPFEYMLTVSYKLLTIAGSFCNSEDKMRSQHDRLFFFKGMISPNSDFPQPKYLFLYSHIYLMYMHTLLNFYVYIHNRVLRQDLTNWITLHFDNNVVWQLCNICNFCESTSYSLKAYLFIEENSREKMEKKKKRLALR